MENPFKIAVEHTLLLFRSRIQTASITDEQKQELFNIVDQCEKRQPSKLSNLKKIGKFEEFLKLFDAKFEEYAGPEAFKEICQEVDMIYNECSMGINIDNMKEKLSFFRKEGEKCLSN